MLQRCTMIACLAALGCAGICLPLNLFLLMESGPVIECVVNLALNTTTLVFSMLYLRAA